MALVRWDPFREVGPLSERMNRLFGEGSRLSTDPAATTVWSPAVDILEKDNELVIKAELPGLDRKDIDIRIENNVLTLKGERKFEKETKDENYHRIEREYGTFVRSFSLPSTVDEGAVRAEYRDGVLNITVPKREAVKPKSIKITAV